jgi:hypothetical protein
MRARRSLSAAGLALVSTAAAAALALPETRISYRIEARLDPATRRLEGRETIRWTNPSASRIDAIPLHLYLNAFSHEDTTWMRGVPKVLFDPDEFLRIHDDPWGFIEPRSIHRGGLALAWRPIAPDDGNPFDRTLAEVTLDRPVLPGETVELELEFEARLPIPMARTGGREDFFLVAQWFPKVAVLETAGTRGAPQDRWAAHQFHGPTEFYADYADFDVRIGVPPGWAVVATGKGGPEESGGEIAWHRYRQRAVHDFAWAAGSRMVDLVSSHQPAGAGGPVEVHLFVPRGTEPQAPRWLEATAGSLDVLGSRVGPYPYDTLTVVLPPLWASAALGMEYPTLIVGGPGDPILDSRLLRGARLGEPVIAHEFAHQYFYGVIGTNEFEDAYLDEGSAQYWEDEILILLHGDETGRGTLLGRTLGVTAAERLGLPAELLPEPVWSGPSYLARDVAGLSQFYSVPAVTFQTAAALFGQATVDRIFAAYYERWAFRHPGLEDFIEVAREAGGDAVAGFVLEAFTEHRLPDYRVASLETEVWERPRGRIVTEAGVIEPDAEASDEIAFAGLDPAAREAGGRILVEILDPGWTRGDERAAGRIERREVAPDPGDRDDGWTPAEQGEEEFHLSTVRLEGAGWQHLPAEVRFRFADGATFRETWDGRAGYRIYRFLRAAPLSESRVDPGTRIALDPDPANNALTREPEGTLVDDWSAWLGALAQLLAEGLGQWL